MNLKAAVLVIAALLGAALASAEVSPPSGPNQAQVPEAKKGDPRVGAVLDRLGVKYTVNPSGNYSVTYDLDGGRSQTVYIMSETDTYNGVEIREIWSNAGDLDSEPAADQLVDLMTESGKNKVGCWALEAQDDGKYLLFYTIKFPADAGDAAYRAMLEFASSVADEREEAIFGVDEN